MMKTAQIMQSIFGPLDAYISTRSEEEKRFWQTPQPSEIGLWQSAKVCPGGRWYLIRAILVRQLIPAVLAFVLLACCLALIISLLLLVAANK
jgi:hypothetical protein